MTNDQIEAAACHYCRLMGEDPNAMVPHPGATEESAETYPVWTFIAGGIQKRWRDRLMDQAIDYVISQQQANPN